MKCLTNEDGETNLVFRLQVVDIAGSESIKVRIIIGDVDSREWKNWCEDSGKCVGSRRDEKWVIEQSRRLRRGQRRREEKEVIFSGDRTRSEYGKRMVNTNVLMSNRSSGITWILHEIEDEEAPYLRRPLQNWLK